ncbi:EKC/KEOPS complex subunit LAGE3-like [Moschus berezovskii]|uniref:EKC/KEOPS complex subunit LAGE3-like n=1 Tax=Moschus berezovskii TaxID=68408 RepID=UPI00244438D8|nr:EKC/KEOPS complex subunit LAGE3-like [Moschus berezovskii]
MESEAHSGAATRAANEEAGDVALAAGTVRGSHSMPGGVGGHAGPAIPPGPGDAVSRGVPAGPADLANPRVLSTARESGGAASAIPQIPGAPHTPGPGGDAAPGATVQSNRALQLYPIPGPLLGQLATGVRVSLNVLFSSHAEADIARQILNQRTRLRGPIQKEIEVNGRMLVLRLTAEDSGLLQRSATFCQEQLSLMMRSLQHFGAPVSQHGRGV